MIEKTPSIRYGSNTFFRDLHQDGILFLMIVNFKKFHTIFHTVTIWLGDQQNLMNEHSFILCLLFYPSLMVLHPISVILPQFNAIAL